MTDNTAPTTGTVPPPQVWPTLQAHDAHGLIDFLCTAFGFEKVAVYAEGTTVHHAELSWPPGGGIMLGSYQPDSDWSREPGTFGGYVVTDEPDELCERARAAGARILREPTDQDYGNREFSATDPEGNMWSFGPYRGQPVS